MKIKSKVWIENEKGETIISYGKYILLKEIEKKGSISAAAKKMGTPFRKAWVMVKTMNERSLKPLVVTRSGGKDGGGAELTEEGKKLVRLFETINNNVENSLRSFENLINIKEEKKDG